MARTKYRSIRKFTGKRKRQSSSKEFASSSSVFFNSTDKQTSVADDLDSTTIANVNINNSNNTIESSTSKKLNNFHHESVENGEITGYRLVDINFLRNLISTLNCSNCNLNLQNCLLLEQHTNGLSSEFSIKCNNCGEICSESSTSQRLSDEKQHSTGFDVNRRSVMAMKELGGGKADLDKFARIFDMPSSLGKESFIKHLKKLESASTGSAQAHLLEAAEIIRRANTDLKDENPDGVLDIAVVCDGSWQKRGYSSHINVTTITDLLTGLVLDYQVITNYCPICSKNQANKSSTWHEDHKSVCPINHVGSSKSMETAAAVMMFQRSTTKYRFRYTTLLNDGDSSVYNRIQALNDNTGPYGIEHPVRNEDCVNHVSKRMKNGLDSVIAKFKAKGEAIDGKGRLTKDRVRAIQNYYGRAIKDNAGDLDGMHRNTWAIYLHYFEDSENQHHKCPSGSESWCWFNRQLAAGIKNPVRETHTPPLPERVSQAILPVFERLCNKSLLRRCLRGATQNANESFNQLIWKRAPKHRFASYQAVCHAVASCCMEFNQGTTSSLKIMKNAGLTPSCNAEKICNKRDTERKRLSLIQGTDRFKKIRKSKELDKLSSAQKQEKREGDSYKAGGF